MRRKPRRPQPQSARTPAVQLHIEELVLHGFAPADRYRIAAAVQLELTRLLAEHGVSPALQQGGEAQRLNVIFGYLLAGWITLLSLGAQFPNDNSIGYYAFVVAFLLAIGWGYWRSRRKRERAEEIFP